MKDTDVLIVGAGPTGLTLALELSLHNIPFRILDSATSRSPYSRALVLHSRTLELLSRHPGLVEQLLPLGRMNMAVRMFANKGFVFEMDVEDLGMKDTRFPTPLMISQAETEGVLEGRLAELGSGVARGCTAESMVQDDVGCTVMVKKEDGSVEEVKCKYVVGCDGAHSIVRKSAGLQFEGAAYPQDFILADVTLKWDQKDCLTVFIGSYGFMGCFPMKDGVFRIICSRLNERDNHEEPTLKDFEETFAQLTPWKVELSDPVWISRFRLHHRIVGNYRMGRMFVAGDAAHIHSPAGGQGMNTGMQDSINLAWKLAAVIRGEKEHSILDTYNIERHKVGQNLLRGTDRAFEFMATSNPVYLFIRNTLVPWVVPWVMSNREMRRNRFRFVSQLGIRYRQSPIVGQASTWKSWVIRGGDRVPDGKVKGADGETTLHALIREAKYYLILFSGIGSAAVDEAALDTAASDFVQAGNGSVKIYKILSVSSSSDTTFLDDSGEVHGLFDFKNSGFVLTRPDGHVAFIGALSAMNELKTFVEK